MSSKKLEITLFLIETRSAMDLFSVRGPNTEFQNTSMVKLKLECKEGVIHRRDEIMINIATASVHCNVPP